MNTLELLFGRNKNQIEPTDENIQKARTSLFNCINVANAKGEKTGGHTVGSCHQICPKEIMRECYGKSFKK